MTTLNIIIQHQPYSNPLHKSIIRSHLVPPKSITLHPFKKNISTKTHDHRFVPRCTQKPSEHDNEPRKAFEWVYGSMKNQNLREIFEMVGDGSQSLRYDPLTFLIMKSLKKQGSTMLSSLMAFIANHLEVVIKTTATEEGPDIGLRWNFEWKNIIIPLGPASSLYTSHVYHGRIILRNGKALIQPLLNLELLKNKMKEAVTPMSEKILHKSLFGGKKVAALLNCFLALFFMAISLLLWKKTLV